MYLAFPPLAPDVSQGPLRAASGGAKKGFVRTVDGYILDGHFCIFNNIAALFSCFVASNAGPSLLFPRRVLQRAGLKRGPPPQSGDAHGGIY